jgi:hypothetical protein
MIYNRIILERRGKEWSSYYDDDNKIRVLEDDPLEALRRLIYFDAIDEEQGKENDL